MKTSKRRQWHGFSVFIVNFEHISHLYSSVSIVDFEDVIASWVKNKFLKSRSVKSRMKYNKIFVYFTYKN